MPDEQLTATVCRVGTAAGLDAVGVAPAEPFLDTRRDLEERKAAGLHGGMQFTYRNPARSTDPTRVLAHARALVVGARRYDREAPTTPAHDREAPTPTAYDREAPTTPAHDREAPTTPAYDREAPTTPAHNRDAPATGAHDRDAPPPTAYDRARIARYSWRDHYAPLRQALHVVAEHLIAEGYHARVLVDDNALVDRQAAYRAGLGWYGKNTNLLLPGRGSWFVLGSVVTDAPLSPAAEPASDGCGTCRRCLPACPTGALIQPGVLDARRCLAWLLEAPGVFPAEYRAALGDRIYGCDDCQEVCPINVRATQADPAPPAEADAEPSANVVELLTGDDRQLLERYGRWYIANRQPSYIRRNALIVLGNVGRPDDAETERVLRRYLAGPDPMLRAHAVWAAARIGRRDLLDAVTDDPDPKVRIELADLPERRAP